MFLLELEIKNFFKERNFFCNFFSLATDRGENLEFRFRLTREGGRKKK